MMRRILLVLAVLSLATAPGMAFQVVPEVRKPQIDPLSRNFLNPFVDDFLSPTDAGLTAEEVRITNSSGESLRAWFLPRDGATHTVMFCMGNTGNISCMLMYARILHDGGYNVLLFDYQGFGDSMGTATAMSLLDDSLCAYDYLTQTRGLKPQTIGVFGVSLGSALAISVAVEREVAAVAVEDVLLPNQKIEDVRRQLPKDLPTQMAISAVQTLIIPRVDPVVNVPKLTCPLFLMHGERDRLLLPSNSIEVARLSKVPTRLWLMESAGHAPETLEVNDREYASQLQRFFREAFAGKVDEPAVTFASTEAENSWSTEVKFDSRARQSWQICFSSNDRRHYFQRRIVEGAFAETIATPFQPDHVSVIAFEHVRARTNGTWTPALSELSQALVHFRVFESRAWQEFPFERNLKFSANNGFTLYERRLSRVWDDIKDKLPDHQTVLPRVRPRYGELLAHLYSQLDAAQQNEAIAMLEAARLYLPERPDEYYQLDNAGFRVGAKQQPWAFWTLMALARARHRSGELDEAKSLLREALVYNLHLTFTEERIDALQADSEFFAALGFAHLKETGQTPVPIPSQRVLIR